MGRDAASPRLPSHCGTPRRLQIDTMRTFLTILVAIGLLATLGTLFAGMLGLVRQDDGSAGRSNALMRWRVLLQGVTLVLFALLLLLSRG